MRTADSPQPPLVYEPPKVESVMTADELAREIQYAGRPSLVADGLN
jgi:hypothetical protein